MKKFLLFLILSPLALLLAKCTMVHYKHDAAAQRLLVELKKLPLPQDSRLLYEQSEVGNYYSATGDATDILAYRAFVTDLPAQQVSDFFAPLLKQRREFDMGLRGPCEPPNTPYLDMDSIFKHVPQTERKHAYLLYALDRCEEAGLWDARGW